MYSLPSEDLDISRFINANRRKTTSASRSKFIPIYQEANENVCNLLSADVLV
jgi:hypothetical protein